LCFVFRTGSDGPARAALVLPEQRCERVYIARQQRHNLDLRQLLVLAASGAAALNQKVISDAVKKRLF
jgi:hypothetical protein